MIDVMQVKIDSSIKECNSHIEKLIRSKRLLSEFFPLEPDKFKNLDEEQIEHLDQFIYRFTRLQDSMGKRLLPSLISYIDNDFSPKSFLDILARLEQLGIIENDTDWQFFRNLRNNLAHDYPDNIKIMTETLNLLFEELPRLENMFSGARDYYLKKKKNKFRRGALKNICVNRCPPVRTENSCRYASLQSACPL
jgi:hypothetical protein